MDEIELELCRAKQEWISFDVNNCTLQGFQAKWLTDKGFSRRPEPLVRGTEIDIESFAKEMFEVCVYPGLEKWEEQTNHIKTRWRTNAEIIRDKAHVWLKEVGG